MGDVRLLVDELRRRGIEVHEWPGWYGRGNGVAQIDIRGAIIHHTASPYGSAYQTLVSGRAGLNGMLCNFSGNADGSVTVIGSGLAWHAGGGYGPNQGPLAPYASNRNYYTVGIEIVYPGNSPMTDAQYKTALKFAKAVADLFAGGDINSVRGHGEVNGKGYEGKWDPGWSPGQMIDMNKFRRDALAVPVTSPPPVPAPIVEEKEAMFQTILLPPTQTDVLNAVLIPIPWVGGENGVEEAVHINIATGQSDMRIGVAYWQVNTDGKRTAVPAVANGTILPMLNDTGGRRAPANTWGLLLTYSSDAGGAVIIEAV